MDRFHLMMVYIAVAEAESFARAARKLELSPPAVTRAITTLERRLGVKLLTRTTRFVRTTDAGRRYLESARRILAELNEADDAAAGLHGEPRGHLAVTAPVLFGRMYVIPNVVDYLKRFPEISVSALLLDRVVNLLEEGIDIGIRIGDLPDSTLRAIHVGHVRRVICASPDYLARNGIPITPRDLTQHTIIAASTVLSTVEWRFKKHGESIHIPVHPRLTITNNDAAIEAAKQGLGLTCLLSYQVAPAIANCELQIVLRDYEPPAMPIHIVHHEGRQASAKLRNFVDHLVDRLRSNPSLENGDHKKK